MYSKIIAMINFKNGKSFFFNDSYSISFKKMLSISSKNSIFILKIMLILCSNTNLFNQEIEKLNVSYESIINLI